MKTTIFELQLSLLATKVRYEKKCAEELAITLGKYGEIIAMIGEVNNHDLKEAALASQQRTETEMYVANQRAEAFQEAYNKMLLGFSAPRCMNELLVRLNDLDAMFGSQLGENIPF